MADFALTKMVDDQRLVFGWASVAKTTKGETVSDYEDDQIDMQSLEKVMYDFVEKYRAANVSHAGPQIGDLVECVVFTKEKMAAMNIPEGTVPEGVWLGFKVASDVFEKVKNKQLEMFSIEGTGQRVPITE